jgi:hypothetical protein
MTTAVIIASAVGIGVVTLMAQHPALQGEQYVQRASPRAWSTVNASVVGVTAA